MSTFPKNTRCPYHHITITVGSRFCGHCPHCKGEADEGKSVECALGGKIQQKKIVHYEIPRTTRPSCQDYH